MITFLKDLIIEAGKICKKEQSLLTPLDIEYKNKKDIVTLTDKRVENFIVEHIQKKYPSHNIFGEETGKTHYNSDYTWIIDPIDGTTSFLHQQPFFSISIALQHKGQIILAPVYAPAFNELFYAQAESGAFIVKQAMGSVTDFTGASDFPNQGIVATSTLLRKQLLDNFRIQL